MQPRYFQRGLDIRLWQQGGRTERGGGAGLEQRAGIVIRRGGSLPRSAALLSRLRKDVGEKSEQAPPCSAQYKNLTLKGTLMKPDKC